MTAATSPRRTSARVMQRVYTFSACLFRLWRAHAEEAQQSGGDVLAEVRLCGAERADRASPTARHPDEAQVRQQIGQDDASSRQSIRDSDPGFWPATLTSSLLVAARPNIVIPADRSPAHRESKTMWSAGAWTRRNACAGNNR
jgi:hypothetical protein